MVGDESVESVKSVRFVGRNHPGTTARREEAADDVNRAREEEEPLHNICHRVESHSQLGCAMLMTRFAHRSRAVTVQTAWSAAAVIVNVVRIKYRTTTSLLSS